MKTENWKSYWPFLAALLAVVAVFLLFPPFYGLMDDSGFVFQAPDFLRPGAWDRLSELMRTDFEVNGRFRPFLPVLMVGLYGFTQGHPLVLHLLNGVIVTAVLAFLTLSFQRLWRRLYPSENWMDDLFVPVFFSLLLLYPWTHLGLALPSMQEKTVFFFGALTLWTFTSASVDGWEAPARIAARGLLICVGAFTREQFIFFFPALLAASFLAERKKGKFWETLLYLLLMAGLVLLIWLMGRHSNYKAKYGLANALVTIGRSRSLWVFLALAFASFVRSFFGPGSLGEKFGRTCFSLGLLGFVLIMIPWGMGGYLNTIAAPFAAGCLLTLLPRSSFVAYRPLLFWVLPVLSLATMTGQLGMDSIVKNDLGHLLASEEMKAISRTHLLYAPCLEGMDSMNTYTQKFFGYSLGAQLPSATPPALSQQSYWVVSRHLGCWPDAFDPDALLQSGQAQLVWQGHARWSWRLIKIGN
jgi:hypothetical protein